MANEPAWMWQEVRLAFHCSFNGLMRGESTLILARHNTCAMCWPTGAALLETSIQAPGAVMVPRILAGRLRNFFFFRHFML